MNFLIVFSVLGWGAPDLTLEIAGQTAHVGKADPLADVRNAHVGGFEQLSCGGHAAEQMVVFDAVSRHILEQVGEIVGA